jgi:hypothetical protein
VRVELRTKRIMITVLWSSITNSTYIGLNLHNNNNNNNTIIIIIIIIIIGVQHPSLFPTYTCTFYWH